MDIAEAVQGKAAGGSFIVLFRGLSETIAYDESQSSMASKLSGVIGQTVNVTRSDPWQIRMDCDVQS